MIKIKLWKKNVESIQKIMCIIEYDVYFWINIWFVLSKVYFFVFYFFYKNKVLIVNGMYELKFMFCCFYQG